MSKIYYAVRPAFSTVPRFAEEGNSEKVYDLVMEITGDHNEAANASGWCDVATIGEVYNGDGFTVEIIED